MAPSEDPLRAPGLTYDELRRQNRENFEQRRYESMKKNQGGNFPPGTPPPPSRDYPESDSFSGSLSEGRPKQGVENSYGDVWDK